MTFMVYLTDVEEGGNTAFPRLNVAVTPQKGDAAFWLVMHAFTPNRPYHNHARYNLLPDGSGDTMTLHGGCPVLRGAKHVANKWSHWSVSCVSD